MATSKSQRITIWVIAAMMALGSVGFYFLIIIENNDIASQQAELQQQLQEVQQAQPLPGYEATAFQANNVNDLSTDDLEEGDGETIVKGDNVTVNYMGWLPDGTIFDSSNRSGTPEPIVLQIDDGVVIDGWVQGIPGMKVGGVRQLVIPAGLAYGEQGQPPSIPANTPLTFIVEAVSVE